MACVSALTIASISSLSINNPLLRPSSVHPLIPLFNSVKSPLKSRQCIQRFPFRRSSSSGWLTEKRHQASSESRVGTNHEEEEEEEEKEEISQATLIWRAIKLPIYSVALVPLTVGSAAAYLQAGVFSAKRYFVLLSSSILIITWLNLSNDVYDFDTGADKNKKESVVNIFGSRTGTLIAAYVLLALGFMGLTWAYAEAANIRPMLLLTCAVIFGYIYQCPPFRLSYQGLGEPLCFAAFGPFATTAFYLMHSRSEMYLPITGTVLSASLLVGLTTTLILFCSHFHQVDEDSAVGKLSPLVRIGTKTGSQVVKVAVVTLYSLLFALGLSKLLPITSVVLCALTLPIGIFVVRFVEGNHSDKGKIFMAKYFCVRLHAAFGAALSVGMMIARIHYELKMKNNNSIEALDFFWVICFYYFPIDGVLTSNSPTAINSIADRKRHNKDIILACCGSTELINNYPWRTARLGD